ncbi:hypothetical protein HK096_005044, partial [Nowakowskiella sp. JEL0078]
AVTEESIQNQIITLFSEKSQRPDIRKYANLIARQYQFNKACQNISIIAESNQTKKKDQITQTPSSILKSFQNLIAIITHSRITVPFLEAITSEPVSQRTKIRAEYSIPFLILEEYRIVHLIPKLLKVFGGDEDFEKLVAIFLIEILRRGSGTVYLAHVIESEMSENGNWIEELLKSYEGVSFDEELVRSSRSVADIGKLSLDPACGNGIGENELNEVESEIEIECCDNYVEDLSEISVGMNEVIVMLTYQMNSFAAVDRILWKEFREEDFDFELKLLIQIGIFKVGKHAIASSISFTNKFTHILAFLASTTPTTHRSRICIHILSIFLSSSTSISRILDPEISDILLGLLAIDFKSQLPFNQQPQTPMAALTPWLQPLKEYRTDGLHAVLTILVTPRTLRELQQPASLHRVSQCLRLLFKNIRIDEGAQFVANYINDADFVEFEGVVKADVTLVEFLVRLVEKCVEILECLGRVSEARIDYVVVADAVLGTLVEIVKCLAVMIAWYDYSTLSVAKEGRDCPLTSEVDDDGWLVLMEPKEARPVSPLFQVAPVLFKLLGSLQLFDLRGKHTVERIASSVEKILDGFMETVLLENGKLYPRYLLPLERTLKFAFLDVLQDNPKNVWVVIHFLGRVLPSSNQQESNSEEDIKRFSMYWVESLNYCKKDILKFFEFVLSTSIQTLHEKVKEIFVRIISLENTWASESFGFLLVNSLCQAFQISVQTLKTENSTVKDEMNSDESYISKLKITRFHSVGRLLEIILATLNLDSIQKNLFKVAPSFIDSLFSLLSIPLPDAIISLTFDALHYFKDERAVYKNSVGLIGDSSCGGHAILLINSSNLSLIDVLSETSINDSIREFLEKQEVHNIFHALSSLEFVSKVTGNSEILEKFTNEANDKNQDDKVDENLKSLIVEAFDACLNIIKQGNINQVKGIVFCVVCDFIFKKISNTDNSKTVVRKRHATIDLFSDLDSETNSELFFAEILPYFEFSKRLKVESLEDLNLQVLESAGLTSELQRPEVFLIFTDEHNQSTSLNDNNTNLNDANLRNKLNYRQYQKNEFRTSHNTRKANTSRPPSTHVDDFMKHNIVMPGMLVQQPIFNMQNAMIANNAQYPYYPQQIQQMQMQRTGQVQNMQMNPQMIMMTPEMQQRRRVNSGTTGFANTMGFNRGMGENTWGYGGVPQGQIWANQGNMSAMFQNKQQ